MNRIFNLVRPPLIEGKIDDTFFQRAKCKNDMIESDTLKERAIKSVFWLGGAKFIGQAINWVLTILLVRILNPEDFGIMGMAAVYQAVIIILYDLNLGSAIVQKSDLKDDDLSTCFWFICFLSLILYFLTWNLAPFVGEFFKNNKVVNVLRVYAIATLLDSFQIVPFWLLSRRLDFDKRAKAEFSSNIFHGVVQISMAFLGYGVWSLVFGFIAKYSLLCILVFLFSKWTPKPVFNLSRLKEMLCYSIPLTGSKLLRYVSSITDIIIIGRMFDAKSLGYYRVALDLSRIPQDKIMTIVNQIAFPVFSRLQNDRKGLRYYFIKLNFMLVLILLPIYLGGAVVANDLILLFLTEKWIEIRLPFQIFCVLGIIQCLNVYYFMLLNAIGKSSLNFKLSILSAILLPASFIVGSHWGVIGICYSWLIAFPIIFVYMLMLTMKELEMSILLYVKSILHPIAATFLMCATVYLSKSYIYPKTMVGLISEIMIGIGIYWLYFILFSKDTYSNIYDIIETVGIGSKMRRIFAFKR